MKSDYTMDHLPIPPQTTRISVQLGDILHRLDVPSDRLGDCLDDFEGSFTLPLRTYRGTVAGIITVGEIARNAAACGYKLTMTQAALWLLVHGGQERALDARRELERLIDQEGGTLIKASCSGFSRGWNFEVLPTRLAKSGEPVFPMSAAPAGAIL